MEDKNYNAGSIQVLEGLEPVRKRPGMYIGSTGTKGLHHCVMEVMDNSIDEVLAGRADTVKVVIYKDGSISVEDNGSGIPVEVHPKTGKSTLETVLTVLHAGGKFNNDAYKVSGGLHGVGVSCVNALSEWLIATVKRGGHIYEQHFARGKAQGDIEVVGDTKESGTTIQFMPDEEIFDTTEFSKEVLVNKFRETAFLNKGVRITLIDEREEEPQEEVFHYEGGIKSFVEYINRSKNAITNDIIYFDKSMDDCELEIAMQYTDGYSENVLTFANNIHTTEGGYHLTGFRNALTRALNDYGRKANIIKEKEENLSGDDAREGLTAIVSVKLKEPQFEGQTKSKLGNSEVQGIVNSVAYQELNDYFELHPQEGKKIIEKAISAQRAREAARKARDLSRGKKSVLDNTTLPGKLADCQSNDNTETEIFIVEGDSAGGSAKQGRDRKFQAILPLRGKILNVEKARLDKILAYEEIKAMITAFGTGIDTEFNIEKLRYGKIIIMTDADVDGAHIRTLLLTFFFRHMRELVDDGHIYIAQPPLYMVSKNRKEYYVYDDDELEDLLKEIGRDNYTIQRYKGLGEMNPEQLWETTMDPEHRILLRVNVDDAVNADEIFSMLMGDKVEPRREFIEKNAKYASNLDI
ncbi:MAG: DNA topoisomerase (ATP-hydrolyzing) subunit B [Eubacteriales bacterium]|uniref:DNA topoisomerase (ATP-hydrolyzing) subunit B n=1 Tax=Fenollaria sp. TaxID=1965292 RepID=UPI002A74E59D|nr:DNA topoisomerase (ATP-hydrolyzing) subunit B [Fenollaria sp.]MDD7340355.1 DNA topoisomerase (ATP-hydrolyzing) subunit B [Eubacteriales bacterium]MDY3105249.1 DNA topoisomerase (ATP-hydrolyzing) subunit B [Fenollaria sp.]